MTSELNSFSILLSSIGVPMVLVNTWPLSFQLEPAQALVCCAANKTGGWREIHLTCHSDSVLVHSRSDSCLTHAPAATSIQSEMDSGYPAPRVGGVFVPAVSDSPAPQQAQ